MRVLFVCDKARGRSPTAAQIFAQWDGVSTEFGGIGRDTDDALSADQIDWAELILVMERRHATRLSERFRHVLAGKRVVVLDVRDRYGFMDPRLVDELLDKAGPYLR